MNFSLKPLTKIGLFVIAALAFAPPFSQKASASDKEDQVHSLALLMSGGGQQKGAVANSSQYPWSALGRLNLGGKNHCTGTMISKDQVLTRASCLYNSVEGRWWAPNEVHFRAGYQGDQHLASSDVRAYQVPRQFRIGKHSPMSMGRYDWALVSLSRPIGQQTGWLGMRRLTNNLKEKINKGDVTLLQAGYRAGYPHAVQISAACTRRVSAITLPNQGDIPCQTLFPSGKSTQIVFENGKFRLVSDSPFAGSFQLASGYTPVSQRARQADSRMVGQIRLP